MSNHSRTSRRPARDAPVLVVTNWLGVFAPAHTPREVIEKLDTTLRKTVALKQVQDAFQKNSATATAVAGPDQFQKFVAAECQQYGQLLRERNIVIAD